MKSNPITFFLSVALFVAVTSSEETSEVKNEEHKLGRIFLGRQAIRNEFPFVVRIQEKKQVTWWTSKFIYCSGVIVHPRWILTSGPCGDQPRGSSEKAWIYPKLESDYACHSTNTSCLPTTPIDNKFYEVQKIFNVDQPADKWYKRQLKLMKLKYALKRIDAVVRLVNFTNDPFDRIKEIEGFRVRIAGYGAQSNNSAQASTFVKNMKMANVLLRNHSECIAPSDAKYQETHYICLESGFDGTTACSADSGGPIVYQDPVNRDPVVIGLMNDYGGGCYLNPINMGFVYGTRVAPFRDRIQDIMGNDKLL